MISYKSRKSYILYFHKLKKKEYVLLGSNPNTVILTTTRQKKKQKKKQKTLHYVLQNLYNLKMEVIIK